MLQFQQPYEFKLSISKSEPFKGNKITCQAPFDKCDRVEDYKVAWEWFEKIFKETDYK